MKYRIMLAVSKKDNYETLYQYKTTEVDGEIKPKEFSTEQELDAYVENLLNKEGYSKSDFIIVSVVDYNVEADIYNNVN